MDNEPHATPDTGVMLDQVLNVGIEWARRARDRSITVVAVALDDLDALLLDYGAARIDELLGVIGARLAKLQNVAAVRSGDGFVLVSTAPRSRFDAFSLAERAERAIQRTHVLDGCEIVPTASMGIRVSHGLGSSGAALLRDAEIALDEAKDRGASEIVMFNPALHRRHLDGRAASRAALQLQFEPIVALADGHVTTYEAVVASGPSFRDADRETFDALLAEVVRTAATWPADVEVSFDVTAAHLLDRTFPQRVAAAAHRGGIDPTRFVFELDEAEAAADLLRLEEVLLQLSHDHWHVGIDNLGAHKAPLDILTLLPLEFVKIDRSLVDQADESELELLATVSAAARSLQVATIATGIATLPELALAIAHDYDFAQGSLFGVQVSTPPPAGPARD